MMLFVVRAWKRRGSSPEFPLKDFDNKADVLRWMKKNGFVLVETSKADPKTGKSKEFDVVFDQNGKRQVL